MSIKEILKNLSEDELRKKIVIPFLKVLGFKNVEDWCGPQEKGKDVLYVKEDPLGQPIVGALLIKNDRDIKKSGKNDIRKIESQAREAITTQIPDPRDPYIRTNIRGLYILTSFNIEPEARNYILNALGNSQLYLTFIDGNQLEERIKKIIGTSGYIFSPDDFEQFCKQKTTIVPTPEEVPTEPTIGEVSEGKNIEPKLAEINKIIQSGEFQKNQDIILNYLKDKELKFYFLKKFPKKIRDLKKIEFLLEELVKDERPFELLNILENSINKKNNDFIIKFIQKHYGKLNEVMEDNMFQEESLKLLLRIITEQPHKVIDDVFNLAKDILDLRKNEYKKLETRMSYDSEKEFLSELLEKIFTIYKKQVNNEKN